MLTVIYRITSVPSTNPPPVHAEDKDALNEMCLKSFFKAYSDIEYALIVLADHCSQEMLDSLEMMLPDPQSMSVIPTAEGINATMLRSYDIASKLDGEVLFQECDYLYKGVVGKKMLQAIRALKLVSPYDHPNFYQDHSIHSEVAVLRIIDNHHFRSTERNTMTWGCDAKLIRENKEMLDKYGYLDNEVWRELREAGYPLWVPIPGFATHMAKDWLSFGVDWGL